MRSAARSVATQTRPFQSRTPASLLRNSKLVLAGFLLAAIALSACGPKIRPFLAKEAVDALREQANSIKTARGRAWISAKTPEQSISFPAIIAIDRGSDRASPSSPRLRIEAIDPVGATHALVILSPSKTHDQMLTWVDFDQRRVYEQRGKWHGFPLSNFPDLILGLAPLPESGKVSAVSDDHFVVRTATGTIEYLMEWLNPGPRLALQGLVGTFGTHEKYDVRYSKFLDKADFFLAIRAELKGASPSGDIEMRIDWRDRRFNEDIPAEAFQIPQSAMEGFTHEPVRARAIHQYGEK